MSNTQSNNSEEEDRVYELIIKFNELKDNAENFINNNNKKDLLKFRDILMNKKLNLHNNVEKELFLSILHFWGISEVNGILFSLLEEMKKSFHHLKGDQTYNNGINFYYFFKDLVFYDSSQINFNYFSSILSTTFINIMGETRTYFLCLFLNIVSLILLYLFHITELNEEYENEFNYLLKTGCFYLFIYIFTGIIGLMPFYLLKNKNSDWNIFLINLCCFIGVLLKNLIHWLLSNLIFDDNIFLMLKGILILFLLSGYNFIISIMKKKNKKKNNEKKEKKNNENNEKKNNENNEQNNNENNEQNNNENNEQNNKESYSYFLGNFTSENELSTINIKIEGFLQYLHSIFTESVIIIIFLNFTSRAQKIESKSIFKKEYDEKWLMLLNILISYLIYLIIMAIYYGYNHFTKKKNNEAKNVPNELNENSDLKLDEIKQKKVEEKKNKEVNETYNKIKKQEKKNKKKELFINFVFLFENILSIIFSFLIFFLSEPLFCFFEILFSGSINFILIEYYSVQKINYFSLSGVICIPHIVQNIGINLFS